MFFLRGQTDTKILESKGIKIWKGNTSREFLEQRGLDYEEGDMGPGYGFQWNHFGAEYKGCNVDYKDQGINQINECIRLILEDPTSRRIIFSGWNPLAQPHMALPPCHILFQFYVRSNSDGALEYLDGMLYQRSADLMLGVPYNIASYALVLTLFAKVTCLKPGILKMVFGDVHIYDNHMDGVKTQLERFPVDFPKLIVKETKELREYEYDDLELVGYNPRPFIKMQMTA